MSVYVAPSKVVAPKIIDALWQLVTNDKAPLAGRVAALFTVKQIDGDQANMRLVELAKRDTALRPLALRAMTDRLSQLKGVPASLYRDMLPDSNPAVVSAALIGLSRLAQAKAIDDVAATTHAIQLAVARTTLATTQVAHDKFDPSRVLVHLAIRALRDLNAGQLLLPALESTETQAAQFAALTLREMHDVKVVDGLLARIHTSSVDAKELPLVDLLADCISGKATTHAEIGGELGLIRLAPTMIELVGMAHRR